MIPPWLSSSACAALLLFAGCVPAPSRQGRPQSGFVEDPIVRPADVEIDGRVVVGSPSLTAGITGQGPLSVADIEAWLAAPQNHEPIRWILPPGLSRAGIPDRLQGLTRAKIELGRQLFFDSRLAKDEVGLSCGECHLPRDSFARPLHNLDSRDPHARSVLVVFNRAWSTRQFWDGRAKSLEEQALEPITNPVEMNNTHAACLASLARTPGYQLEFKRIYGGVTIERVADALASFMAALVCEPSPVDYWQELIDVLRTGPFPARLAEAQQLARLACEQPLSPAAVRGWDLFNSERTNCSACHRGANFTDEEFHNIGIGMDLPDPDPGRFRVTGREQDRGAFKTPTLRNIEKTAPYMHRGRVTSLEEVVRYYVQGGYPNPGLSPLIRPLDLTPAEEADLTAFLRALSSPLPQVQVGRLPNYAK